MKNNIFSHPQILCIHEARRIRATYITLSGEAQLNQRLTNKKLHWPKNLLLIKNPQFWSDWADIQAALPIHGLVILTKFHDSRAKIADFFINSESLDQCNFLLLSLYQLTLGLFQQFYYCKNCMKLKYYLNKTCI